MMMHGGYGRSYQMQAPPDARGELLDTLNDRSALSSECEALLDENWELAQQEEHGEGRVAVRHANQ